MKYRFTLAFCASVLTMFTIRATAGQISYSGSITGVFTDPVLVGQDIEGGTLSEVYDQSTTALYSGFGTNSIIWGSCQFEGQDTCGLEPGQPYQNQMTFTGATFSSVPANTRFLLGTLTFANGTTCCGSEIFGGTLALSATVGGTTVDPFSAPFQIWTTSNDDTDLLSPRNADFVYFPAIGVSFDVLESQSATASIYGMIVGDPQLQATDITTTDPNGFIGNGVSDFLAPEPATLGLFATGLIGVVSLKKLRRRA
jgi:hypothetical protein